jgi:hypothetical protein
VRKWLQTWFLACLEYEPDDVWPRQLPERRQAITCLSTMQRLGVPVDAALKAWDEHSGLRVVRQLVDLVDNLRTYDEYKELFGLTSQYAGDGTLVAWLHLHTIPARLECARNTFLEGAPGVQMRADIERTLAFLATLRSMCPGIRDHSSHN